MESANLIRPYTEELKTPLKNTPLTDAEVRQIRQDFPILQLERKGHLLTYLDNAATSQKPQAVIDAVNKFYTSYNSNVHRGVHYLSQASTDLYECSRRKIMRFLNANVACEIIFTKGTTDAINLVAQTYGRQNVGEGDEILISTMEHHSNIVPWQMLCEEKGAKLRVIPINDRGEIELEEYKKLLSEKTKLVALVHISNALGTINPVKEMTKLAHDAGVPVLLDGAQSVPHMKIDVQDIGCDFFACSGHKMYAPTGIGVLYGRAEILRSLPPYQGGGDMILSVSFDKTIYNALPYKFEAGTPNIAGVIGMAAAIDYMTAIGLERIAEYENKLLEHGTKVLEQIEGIKLIGTAKKKAGVLSFTMSQAHPHDIGQILDDKGIAIRAGHHCAQPVMERFGIPATARASLAFYNTIEELDVLGDAVKDVIEIFG